MKRQVFFTRGLSAATLLELYTLNRFKVTRPERSEKRRYGGKGCAPEHVAAGPRPHTVISVRDVCKPVPPPYLFGRPPCLCRSRTRSGPRTVFSLRPAAAAAAEPSSSRSLCPSLSLSLLSLARSLHNVHSLPPCRLPVLSPRRRRTHALPPRSLEPPPSLRFRHCVRDSSPDQSDHFCRRVRALSRLGCRLLRARACVCFSPVQYPNTHYAILFFIYASTHVAVSLAVRRRRRRRCVYKPCSKSRFEKQKTIHFLCTASPPSGPPGNIVVVMSSAGFSFRHGRASRRRLS